MISLRAAARCAVLLFASTGTLGAGRIPIGPAVQAPSLSSRLTLTVENTDVHVVLNKISATFGVNLAISSEVRGNVSVRLAGASLDDALAVTLRPLAIPYSRIGANVFVGRASGQAAPSLSQHIVNPPLRTLMAPATPTLRSITLVHADSAAVADQLRALNPGLAVTSGPNNTLLLDATPDKAAQVEAFAASMDATGPQTVAQMVTPQTNVKFSQLYRLKYLDAKSVAALLKKAYANIQVSVVEDVNGVVVVAAAADQQRIADALAQLDIPSAKAAPAQPAAPQMQPAAYSYGGSTADSTGVDVVTLRAAVPGVNGASSSSASDIATAVLQSLAPTLPDLHITVYASQSQLLLTGSPNTLRIARELIDKLDALPKMVVLETTIYEVDDGVSNNLGLSLNPTVISTTYTETTPAAPSTGGTAPPLLGLQQFSRTPISIGVQLNALVSNNKAKILANPKLTTLSGRTASIRAGDNIAILTTTGGAVGTVATTQLQTFQTGVSLDVTPVINANNFISVTLHPTVNNLSGVTNGVPQISTRDAQTTVALQEGQTLVIGGLIEDSVNKATQKIPILGDLPGLGYLFRQVSTVSSRNELIITVTPHIVEPLSVAPAVGPSFNSLPATPAPLPTVAPNTVLPAPAAATPQVPVNSGRAPNTSYMPLPAAGAPAPTAQAATQMYGPGPGMATSPSDSAAQNAPAASSSTTFVYGQRPTSVPPGNVNDPPHIYYAFAAPTVARAGTPVQFLLVTSPNITHVLLQFAGSNASLIQGSPGVWSGSIPFIISGSSSAAAFQVPVTVNAERSDGVATSLNIPITYMP